MRTDIRMTQKIHKYKAIVSSDWSECLAPCSPFDFIAFNYPELESGLETIFKQYTGNIISLSNATAQIEKMLSDPIRKELMDAYLDEIFITYKGVPDLIEWCLERDILFMINTTGMIGYFQRVFAKGLIPTVPVLSAHPMMRFSERETDPNYLYDLLEIQDKPKNTETVTRTFNISPEKIILMGDSGGDGPHFKWGAGIGAFLIGSMTKPSLENYCQAKGIQIDLRFGLSYTSGAEKDPDKEMQIDFMDLSSTLQEWLER
jgi:2-hydroxy-3-keto-5-methylthiopentenyl-1-phosphate phosphatase